MKRVRTIFLLPAILFAYASCSPATLAQSSDEALRELSQAFVTADARRLAGISTSTVNLGLLASPRSYSRRQATLMLREFFRENRPESFQVVDFTKTGRGWFIEASYVTKDRAAPLTVYLRLRLGEPGWLVKEVLIEEERE